MKRQYQLESEWTFDSPEAEIESLKMRLRFARAATARQRANTRDARWLLGQVHQALIANDWWAAVDLLERRQDILTERRDALRSQGAETDDPQERNHS